MDADLKRYQNDVAYNNLVNGIAVALWDKRFTVADIRSALATAERVNADAELRELLESAPPTMAEMLGE